MIPRRGLAADRSDAIDTYRCIESVPEVIEGFLSLTQNDLIFCSDPDLAVHGVWPYEELESYGTRFTTLILHGRLLAASDPVLKFNYLRDREIENLRFVLDSKGVARSCFTPSVCGGEGI